MDRDVFQAKCHTQLKEHYTKKIKRLMTPRKKGLYVFQAKSQFPNK